ncbi:MAG: hypothetical protein EBS77_00190 [Gammaproteobacteria bacterium]|nr:hypothetical protein [Gammaproteobacteria bacterium]
MNTDTLAAMALMLALEDSVVNEDGEGIHPDAWELLFVAGSPLLTDLIHFDDRLPFTGMKTPSKEQIQLVYESYRSRLQSLALTPPLRAYRHALMADALFPEGHAAYLMRASVLDALIPLLTYETRSG